MAYERLYGNDDISPIDLYVILNEASRKIMINPIHFYVLCIYFITYEGALTRNVYDLIFEYGRELDDVVVQTIDLPKRFVFKAIYSAVYGTHLVQ